MVFYREEKVAVTSKPAKERGWSESDHPYRECYLRSTWQLSADFKSVWGLLFQCCIRSKDTSA
jgi:hypothetical protein